LEHPGGRILSAKAMALYDAIRALGRSPLSHRVLLLLCFTGFSLAGMTITQSEVDEHFAMLVPVFADFNQGMVRLRQVEIEGGTSFSGDVLLPRQPKKVALNAYKDILER
jgi:hypothetical protein